MLSVANLDRVSTTSTKNRLAANTPGRLIAARRAQLGYSLDKIAELTDDVIYRQLLWRVENGHKEADSLTSRQVNALLPALEWTHDDWVAVLNADTNALTDGGTVEESPSIIPMGSRRLPVMDMLSAGPGGEGGTIVDHVTIPDEWRGEYLAYQVKGDSMAPHIPDGATII